MEKRHTPSMFDDNDPQHLWRLGSKKEEEISMDIPAEPAQEMVHHPAHYVQGGIETIDFIEAKALGYHLGNAVKYISRAKHKGKMREDIEKAIWYLQRYLEKECR